MIVGAACFFRKEKLSYGAARDFRYLLRRAVLLLMACDSATSDHSLLSEGEPMPRMKPWLAGRDEDGDFPPQLSLDFVWVERQHNPVLEVPATFLPSD